MHAIQGTSDNWQANSGENIYIFYGTMEDHARGQVEPKGEFFCKLRDPWMPEIEGDLAHGLRTVYTTLTC